MYGHSSSFEEFQLTSSCVSVNSKAAATTSQTRLWLPVLHNHHAPAIKEEVSAQHTLWSKTKEWFIQIKITVWKSKLLSEGEIAKGKGSDWTIIALRLLHALLTNRFWVFTSFCACMHHHWYWHKFQCDFYSHFQFHCSQVILGNRQLRNATVLWW